MARFLRASIRDFRKGKIGSRTLGLCNDQKGALVFGEEEVARFIEFPTPSSLASTSP